MLSNTEENYLKSIVQLTILTMGSDEVGVNKLAEYLSLKPATVSDMVRKLRDKGYINYQKYGKVSLTAEGKKAGMLVIRRHRLWETFLHEKLEFPWDEVHDLAERLEHVHTRKLMDQLDKFLGFPEFDPHGDAIPDSNGNIVIPFRKTLAEGEVKKRYKVIAVADESVDFLRFFDKLGLKINDEIELVERNDFDDLITLRFSDQSVVVSPKFSENVYIVCAKCLKAKDCKC